MTGRLAALTPVDAIGDTGVDVGPTELTARIQALHPQCFGWALACCDYRREDAEDVLQDVYASVLDKGLRFDGHSTLTTWVFGVIRRKAGSRMRRERLREVLGLRNVARIEPTPAPDPGESAIGVDQREVTRRALLQLPRRQREVIQLVFYHDLTIEASAEAMGVSVGSARTHYDRGKKRLAVLMNGLRP